MFRAYQACINIKTAPCFIAVSGEMMRAIQEFAADRVRKRAFRHLARVGDERVRRHAFRRLRQIANPPRADVVTEPYQRAIPRNIWWRRG